MKSFNFKKMSTREKSDGQLKNEFIKQVTAYMKAAEQRTNVAQNLLKQVHAKAKEGRDYLIKI